MLVDYILDPTHEKELIKRRLQAKLGCGSKSILDHDAYVKRSGERGVAELYPRVEDWITSFASAGFVFTDSYHGVIFSLLFHKPFVAFGNAKRGLARFNSLLNVCDLSDRLVLSDRAVVEDIVDCPVEWENVERLRKEQIDQSTSYLCDSLGIVARSNVHAPFHRLSG
jgi:exopolysaccharide biosynthesis predicted pyruvyltransferase EpsI